MSSRWDSLKATQEVPPAPKPSGPPVALIAYDIVTTLGPLLLLAGIWMTLGKILKSLETKR